jgi:hypothetical protein
VGEKMNGKKRERKWNMTLPMNQGVAESIVSF